MLGAIAGDIIGSVYEWDNIKIKDFPLFSPHCFFTDDSILTIALADSLLTGRSYCENLKKFYRLYPDGGYGGSFHRWAQSPSSSPYNSWGNGAAMRISPAGFAFDDLETVLQKAEEFTAVTHNHPEGIKGGQATAAAIFLARSGRSKEEIQHYIETTFGYDLSWTVDEIRPGYKFNESCQETVPRRSGPLSTPPALRTPSAMPFRWGEIPTPSPASPAALPMLSIRASPRISPRRSMASSMSGWRISPAVSWKNTASHDALSTKYK